MDNLGWLTTLLNQTGFVAGVSVVGSVITLALAVVSVRRAREKDVKEIKAIVVSSLEISASILSSISHMIDTDEKRNIPAKDTLARIEGLIASAKKTIEKGRADLEKLL